MTTWLLFCWLSDLISLADRFERLRVNDDLVGGGLFHWPIDLMGRVELS